MKQVIVTLVMVCSCAYAQINPPKEEVVLSTHTGKKVLDRNDLKGMPTWSGDPKVIPMKMSEAYGFLTKYWKENYPNHVVSLKSCLLFLIPHQKDLWLYKFTIEESVVRKDDSNSEVIAGRPRRLTVIVDLRGRILKK